MRFARTISMAAALGAFLSACQPEPDPVEPPQAPVTESEAPEVFASETPGVAPVAEAEPSAEPADECGADKLSEYVNLEPSNTARGEIAMTVGHDRIRYIRPGDVVTMDMRPDRLNVELGEDGRIKLFRCG